MKHYLNIVGHDDEMIEFLQDLAGVDLSGQNLDSHRWFCVHVRYQPAGEIVAALACEFTKPWDCTFTAAIVDEEAITRKLLRGIFQALFSRARRITAHVEANDDHTEDIVQRLGFIYEGFCRRGYDGDRDALVYGMLKEDCMYLPGVRASSSTNKVGGARCTSPTSRTLMRLQPPSNRLM